MNAKNNNNFSCVILAAGKGTRMKSAIPKVVHRLAGLPLIAHVAHAVLPLSPEKIVVIVSPETEDLVRRSCEKLSSRIEFAVQNEQLGTGHAVGISKGNLKNHTSKILVLCGDTPLITTKTLANMLEISQSSEVAVLGMRVDNPSGYGRLIVDENSRIEEIIEENDASAEQKLVNFCNSGIMAISGKYLFEMLEKLTANNNAGEYYLTDIIAIANDMSLHCKAVEADAAELLGINTRVQLADAESILQNRLRLAAMENGVTLIHPESVFFQIDTKIASDVVIHPNVVFGANVIIESGVEIRSFSHIEGVHIKTNATVGPFARIRPNSIIGAGAHIGNFVELKNTILHDGAKANHLSYIGDAEVGEKANIGAGTITCNYDGMNKHKTTIGAGAFIGSNSSLVAPVTIGEKAVIGAGSVITDDVPDKTIAIARAKQVNKP